MASLIVDCTQFPLNEVSELGATLGVVAGLAEFGHRVVELPGSVQGIAEVVAGLGEIGLESNRLAVSDDRFLKLSADHMIQAKFEMGLGVIGLNPDCRAGIRRPTPRASPALRGQRRG